MATAKQNTAATSAVIHKRCPESTAKATTRQRVLLTTRSGERLQGPQSRKAQHHMGYFPGPCRPRVVDEGQRTLLQIPTETMVMPK